MTTSFIERNLVREVERARGLGAVISGTPSRPLPSAVLFPPSYRLSPAASELGIPHTILVRPVEDHVLRRRVLHAHGAKMHPVRLLQLEDVPIAREDRDAC